VSFRGEEEPRGDGREGASGGAVPARVERGRLPRAPWLLLLLALALLALLLIAVLVLWRSLGDDLSGTSVATDSIDSGPKPRVSLTNGPGQVRVEGVEGLDSVEYEVTKHAVASDPAAAKERAAGVPVDLSREDSTFVLETDGGRNTGADYALRVPSGGSVEIESAAGDVEVSGLSGNVTVRADAGDVAVRDLGGAVAVEAPQGDVAMSGVSTDTGQAELEVGSGDVTLQDVVVGTLETRVEAGEVTLSGRFSGGGRVFVETGDITANLPPEDTRDLTLEANIGEVVREAPSGDGGNPENPDGG
jgi:phage baseplate assembly protein gpV